MHRIELLSPAGSEDAFFAAVAAGADAVYFGTNRFNARERAENIRLERLPLLTQIAHAHNVRVYMTLNIVLYDNEFQEAVELVGKAYENGIDAVIVQDLGMISVLHKAFPELEIHASTQMTTHNLAQCRLLAESGVSQVNLSRELSAEEIKPISAFLHEKGIVPEVFIHGAYCISYSGQCYFSGGLYGLPGNRGQCVQPCRREFRSTDGKFFTPFNLKDNCIFSNAEKLAESCGWSQNVSDTERPVCSFKIEGRIKSADYVYTVTSAWREQLDRLENGNTLLANDEKLSLSMNRGFTSGYLDGDIARSMFTSGKKDHSWTECGTVASFRADGGTLVFKSKGSCKTDAPEKGDEVAIYGKDGVFVCNALVKEIRHNPGQSNAVIAINGKLNGKIMPGQTVLRIKHFLSDKALVELKKTLASGAADSRETDSAESGKTAVSVRISGQLDGFLETVWSIRDEKTGKTVAVEAKSEARLSAAQKRSLDAETLTEKFGRLGGTSFFLAETDCSGLAQNLFLPLGELNEIRRKAVTQLSAEPQAVPQADSAQKATVSVPHLVGKQINPKNFRTITLLHTPDEYAARTNIKNENAILALEIPVLFRDGLRGEYISFLNAHPDVIPYFPAILFEADFDEAIRFLSELAEKSVHKNGAIPAQSENSPHAPHETSHLRTIICENAGLLAAAHDAGFPVVPGFHLNITNSYSAEQYCSRFKCPAVIPSPEMTAAQLDALTLPDNTEIWLLPEAKDFLMQSRQCLVGRASGCEKAVTDRGCLERCSRSVKLDGRQGESIIAEKRPGFYSRLLKG